MSALRLLNRGRLIYGGSPPRFMRLTDAGATNLNDLLAGRSRYTGSALGERLVDAGIVPPDRPDPDADLSSFTVVIPHFNDPDAAITTLTALSARITEPDAQPMTVIVVDDGSEPRHRAELALQIDLLDSPDLDIRLEVGDTNRGPAAARNAGTKSHAEEVTVFVDSGVTITRASLESLVGWTTVASAVGPRVVSMGRAGAVGRFEHSNSALDMNSVSHLSDQAKPQLVGPARTVRYLPTAVLAIRTDALRDIGGFDESMRTGEDVDLTWRLADAGHRVVFDPAIVADHEPRSSVRAFVQQRYGYGRSGAPLGQRHGTAIAPAVARVPLLAAVAAFLFAPAKSGVAVGAVAGLFDAAETARRFTAMTGGYPSAGALGATESVKFNMAVARWWVRASLRAWWPLTMIAMVQPFSARLRARAAGVLALRLADFAATVGVSNIPMAVADEVAYGAGLWTGAIHSRSPRALLPRILN